MHPENTTPSAQNYGGSGQGLRLDMDNGMKWFGFDWGGKEEVRGREEGRQPHSDSYCTDADTSAKLPTRLQCSCHLGGQNRFFERFAGLEASSSLAMFLPEAKHGSSSSC